MSNLKVAAIAGLVFILYSCKKAANDSIASTRQLRSIWNRSHKIGDSTRFFLTVDSFVYDNQKRVVQDIQTNFDTVFNANVPELHVMTNTLNVGYDSNTDLPSTLAWNGPVSASGSHITYNNLGQITKVTSPPASVVTTYSNNNNLIVISAQYYTDSIFTNASNDCILRITGLINSSGNNNYTYARTALWSYDYGTVLNPVYANRSLRTVLFFANGPFQSQHLASRSEWISYDGNGAIANHQKSEYQINMNANNEVESIVDLTYGDTKRFFYY